VHQARVKKHQLLLKINISQIQKQHVEALAVPAEGAIRREPSGVAAALMWQQIGFGASSMDPKAQGD
jgi:hypothetical protein